MNYASYRYTRSLFLLLITRHQDFENCLSTSTMILFKKKQTSIFLVTNLKVMYSSLTVQESIEEVPKSLGLFLKLAFHSLLGSKRTKYYLIVRNPYSRLESFFKNKFRSTLPNIIKSGKWQHCHEIFFPFLDLKSNDSASDIAKRLSSISFSEFISLLPLTYKKDGHLFPQSWAKSFYIRKWGLKLAVPLKYSSIFKLESKNDLTRLSEIFHLDLSIKENSTESIMEEIKWSREEVHIINELYHDDFDAYAYDKLSHDK